MTELNFSATGRIEYKGRSYFAEELLPNAFHDTPTERFDGRPA